MRCSQIAAPTSVSRPAPTPVAPTSSKPEAAPSTTAPSSSALKPPPLKDIPANAPPAPSAAPASSSFGFKKLGEALKNPFQAVMAGSSAGTSPPTNPPHHFYLLILSERLTPFSSPSLLPPSAMSKVAAGTGLASAAAPAPQDEESNYPISDRDESSDDDYESDDRAKDDKVPEWAKGDALRKVGTHTPLPMPRHCTDGLLTWFAFSTGHPPAVPRREAPRPGHHLR